VRDDLNKLPLPPEAKAYARRKGLSAMKNQPQSYINMAAAVSGQSDRKRRFKNRDEVGAVSHAIKESACLLVAVLIESDEEVGAEFGVKPTGVGRNEFGFEVPGGYVNYKVIPGGPGPEGKQQAENHMRFLANTRDYPPGSFFVTPWGTYLIHGGTIGEI
jgi:hypothetical protein